MSVIDPPEAVAEVVRTESGWVPQWSLLTVQVGALVLPFLVLWGHLSTPSVAVAVTGSALIARLVPHWAARALHQNSSVHAVRRARQQVLVGTAACGVLALAGVPQLVADQSTWPSALCVSVVVVTQHRPEAANARAGLAAIWAESVALAGLVPGVVWATRGWWQ